MSRKQKYSEDEDEKYAQMHRQFTLVQNLAIAARIILAAERGETGFLMVPRLATKQRPDGADVWQPEITLVQSIPPGGEAGDWFGVTQYADLSDPKALPWAKSILENTDTLIEAVSEPRH